MFGMKFPMPLSCFRQIVLSCEKAAGIFIKVNGKEAILTKNNIFPKIFLWKSPGISIPYKDKFTSQGSLPWVQRCIWLFWKSMFLWDRAPVHVLLCIQPCHPTDNYVCWLHQAYTHGSRSFLTWGSQQSAWKTRKGQDFPFIYTCSEWLMPAKAVVTSSSWSNHSSPKKNTSN